MPEMPSTSVVAGLMQGLRPHPPFGAMADGDLRRIVSASTLRYFAPGEPVLVPGSERPRHCFIIRQGSVRGERPGPLGDAQALWELGPGEMFPLGALLGNRGVTSIYRARGDTFCIAFPAAEFDRAVRSSPPFQDFCTRRLAHLLDVSRARLQAEYAASVTEQRGLATPLGSIVTRRPVACGPGEPIGHALTTMERERIGSILVVDEAGRPVGIFTRQDVIGRIVLPAAPLDTPMRSLMTSPVVTLSRDATAGDAALVMAQRGLRHVVVVDADGTALGVVSERDLFGMQRLSLRELSSAIRRAPDVPALVQAASDIRALSHTLVAQGVAAGWLTPMIASLNDQLTARVLDLVAPAFDLSDVALAWIGMGSEGRGEQTIATDQDNGLVFVPHDPSRPAETLRERLLPFARAVNEELDRCGYPLCKGGVMAMNPRWCASLDEWRGAFFTWIDRGDPDSLLAASIFFDFRPLWGDAGLADALRQDVAERAQRTPRFLKQMSDNALRNRPPLNWRGELAVTEDASGAEGIDLKLNGSVPIVDAARIFALATGVTVTRTVERLRASGERKGVPVDEVRDIVDAFEFVQLLRLRTQHRRLAEAEAEADADADARARNANRVMLDELSELDRRILKEALRQVRKLQQRLELDYPG